MRRRHLVLFARAPQLGRGKRRLADEVGDIGALRFERAMLTLLCRRLGRGRRWQLRLAVTPDRARRRRRLWPPRVPTMGQGGGDLGARMARALAACPAGPAVLVGTDLPGLGARHIADAFRRLGQHDLVFGPAADGGFWLIGSRHKRHLRGLFAGVRWSRPQALADVLRNVPQRLSVGIAARLDDVDDAKSLRRLAPRRGF